MLCGLWSALQESFSLWETKKWLKAVMKGDSVLFICRFGVSSLSLPTDSRPLSTQAPIIISYFSCNLCPYAVIVGVANRMEFFFLILYNSSKNSEVIPARWPMLVEPL